MHFSLGHCFIEGLLEECKQTDLYMIVTIKAIGYTPIKSTKFIWVPMNGEVYVGLGGIEYDREWMITSESGVFVSQRRGALSMPKSIERILGKILAPLSLGIEVRSMCLISSSVEHDHLLIRIPGGGEFLLPLWKRRTGTSYVQIWHDTRIMADDEGDEVAEFLSGFLSKERPGQYRLQRISTNQVRLSKGRDAACRFQDAYPFSVISEASLSLLNRKLESADKDGVGMDRFRPNIVISDCIAHAEDDIAILCANGLTLRGKSLCERCLVTCTDQDSGKRDREPLLTLSEYRKGKHLNRTDVDPEKIYFGRNFDHLGYGKLKVGDELAVS